MSRASLGRSVLAAHSCLEATQHGTILWVSTPMGSWSMSNQMFHSFLILRGSSTIEPDAARGGRGSWPRPARQEMERMSRADRSLSTSFRPRSMNPY